MPTLEDIKGNAATVEQAVSWVSELFSKNNTSKKLYYLMGLLFAIWFWLPNGLFEILVSAYTNIFSAKLPLKLSDVRWGIGILGGVLFIAAVRESIKAKENTFISNPDSDHFKAIKFLNSFDASDTAIFMELQNETQRKAIFTECLEGLLDNDFIFGILCGVSGSGKSSFLKAGIIPTLQKKEYTCIYVKLTDQNPFHAIRSVLLSELKSKSKEEHAESIARLSEAEDFPALITLCNIIDSKPILFVLDQFEQFFVHHSKDKRRVFINTLAQWYSHEKTLSGAFLRIKILVSIREDFLSFMSEFQKTMRYSLAPHQNLKLEKLEPVDAANILSFIAQRENITFNRKFLEDISKNELADREGLISPVDIQIFSWIMANQSGSKGDLGFNEKNFKKIRGVEGLLEQFLKRALDSRKRESNERKEAALKVLLALTEGETRAGVLSIANLKEKLSGALASKDIEEAVEWLASSNVRLITPVNGGFELAHERIIRPLRAVAQEQLSDAERENQKLTRRVNEWISNGKDKRYLLTILKVIIITKLLKK